MGQAAIVTGCSGGLGVQMAKALANQGCAIVPIARHQEKIEQAAKEIHDEYGVETLLIRCDITDTEMVNNMVKTALDHFGHIDILINNAGTGAAAPAEDIADGQFSNEVNIDLFGTFKAACAAAKQAMIPEERYSHEGGLDTAAIFLSSPPSSYVTGVMLPFDGGYTCM